MLLVLVYGFTIRLARTFYTTRIYKCTIDYLASAGSEEQGKLLIAGGMMSERGLKFIRGINGSYQQCYSTLRLL